MNKFKLLALGLMVLFSISCVITVPTGGSNPPTAAPLNSPAPTSTPSRTPEPSITPFPTPTRRATMDVFSTVAAEAPQTLPPSLTPPVAVETTQPGALPTATHPGSAMSVFSPTPRPFECKTEILFPHFGRDIEPRTDFMAAWRIYNIGTNHWNVGEYIFEYFDGEKLQSLDYVPEKLGFTVFPTDRVKFEVHLKSPKAPGRYTTTWGLRRSNKKEPFCVFSLTIDVVK